MDLRGMLIGGAVGDALGFPVEDKTRIQLEQDPVVDMGDNGGVFSDDTSMSWAVCDAILNEYHVDKVADNLVAWYKEGKYTATNKMISIKPTVADALDRYIKNGKISGSKTESENGSGSLMRIAPMILITSGKKIDDRFDIIKNASSITHAHSISVVSCFFFTEFLLELTKSYDKAKAYTLAQNKMKYIFANKKMTRSLQFKFERLYPNKVSVLGEGELLCDKYVISSLETAMWCFINTNSYIDAVLRAVNLGGDTDTIGALTGTLAGAFYGYENIPVEWRNTLFKVSELESLSDKLKLKFNL
jgi:ADP-ribosyl-[dinitrogen reductase] hydrolase